MMFGQKLLASTGNFFINRKWPANDFLNGILLYFSWNKWLVNSIYQWVHNRYCPWNSLTTFHQRVASFSSSTTFSIHFIDTYINRIVGMIKCCTTITTYKIEKTYATKATNLPLSIHESLNLTLSTSTVIWNLLITFYCQCGGDSNQKLLCDLFLSQNSGQY